MTDEAKAGEREQVAEAVEAVLYVKDRLAQSENLDRHWTELLTHKLKRAFGYQASALAEARSEVERQRDRVKQFQLEDGFGISGLSIDSSYIEGNREAVRKVQLWHHDATARLPAALNRLKSAEAERDTLAAQLVGAREALEPFAKHADLAEANFKPGALIDGMFLPYVKLGECRAARQALSMSILRGDKGCSLGAIEAPACGSPADSQPSGGAE